MQYFIFVFKSAFKDFFRNKMRTLLTSLGILIGILSVILLISIGVGLQNFIEEQFDKLGADTLYIVPGKIFSDSGGFRSSYADEVMGLSFDERDFKNLERIREIKDIVPMQTSGAKVKYNKEEEYATIVYTSEKIFPVQSFDIAYGKIFTKEDVSKRAKVAVIGNTLAKNLFKAPKLGIGRDIKINSQSFKVLGVMEEFGGAGLGGPEYDSMIMIPYKTGFLLTGSRDFANFIAKPRNSDLTKKTKNEIEAELLKRYEEDEFSIAEQKEIMDTVTSIFSMINTALVAIAAISLLVGGIGIMNIMYVTVTERIKEIGIRRAIGARKFDILAQFLMESVMLSLIGGAMAIALAYIIVHFIKPYFPAQITTDAVLLALGVSSGIGILFGVLPAKKAADLSPIDAIRYE
jgi:putative ABC transport system permease protein